MSKILDNSVWPNGLKKDSEGYAIYYPLGDNKKDISTITWPEGYKLVSPFVYDSNGKVVGFCDTKSLTVSGNTTTTMPYYHIEANFAAISEGTLTVDAPNAIVKKFKWSVVNSGDDNVIATIKYKGCKTAVDVYVVDPNCRTNDIIDGVWSEGLGDLEKGWYSEMSGIWEEFFGLFHFCSELTSFTSDLSSLRDGMCMFQNCTNLTSFNCNDLSRLTCGNGMFYDCSNLTSFNSDLSSLTDGGWMFSDCTSLTSFSCDLSSLTDGESMFFGCENLTSFISDLSSLADGLSMFEGCKLDASSVKNIIDTIAYTLTGPLTLGMGCNNTTEDINLFAQEAGYNDMTSLLAAFESKDWMVDVQYNGRPSATYSLRRPFTEGTLPVFVKLEEVEETNDKRKSNHTHTSEDGSKKYRLRWFHETTGSTEGYTQFTSLEEAIKHFNIKSIERN